MPASKSLANRELILSALASGRSEIDLGPLDPGDDVRAMHEAVAALGARVDGSPAGVLRITPAEAPAEASVNAGEAGTVARFATALAAVRMTRTTIDGGERLRRRPLAPLVRALCELGASIEGEALPLTVSRPLRGGRVEIPGHESSQFASALLLVSACAPEGIEVRLSGSVVSAPFVEMTIAALAGRGVNVERLERPNSFRVRPQRVRPRRVAVPGDATAASYAGAAAALLGGSVTIDNVDPTRRPGAQGDIRFFEVLERMGCQVSRLLGGIGVRRTGALYGLRENVRDISDTFPTLAMVAACAQGRSEILGIGHTRAQESDRVAAVAAGLRTLGGSVTEFADGLAIDPVPLHGGVVDAAGDHRIAMAFSILGLVVPGVAVDGWEAVSKTFPGFYDMVKELGH